MTTEDDAKAEQKVEEVRAMIQAREDALRQDKLKLAALQRETDALKPRLGLEGGTSEPDAGTTDAGGYWQGSRPST